MSSPSSSCTRFGESRRPEHAADPDAPAGLDYEDGSPARTEVPDLVRVEHRLAGSRPRAPAVAVAGDPPGAPASCEACDQLGRGGNDLTVRDEHREVAHHLLEQALPAGHAQVR